MQGKGQITRSGVILDLTRREPGSPRRWFVLPSNRRNGPF